MRSTWSEATAGGKTIAGTWDVGAACRLISCLVMDSYPYESYAIGHRLIQRQVSHNVCHAMQNKPLGGFPRRRSLAKRETAILNDPTVVLGWDVAATMKKLHSLASRNVASFTERLKVAFTVDQANRTRAQQRKRCHALNPKSVIRGTGFITIASIDRDGASTHPVLIGEPRPRSGSTRPTLSMDRLG